MYNESSDESGIEKDCIVENFESFTPARMILGKNTHRQVGKIVKKYRLKKVLVHSGGASTRKSGLLDVVTGTPEAKGTQYAMLGGVQANLTLTKAREEMKLYLRESVNLVLAVGGDGVVNSTKYIADDAGNLDASVWTYFRRGAVPARTSPVGVILMLSASGSEVSASYVIINEGNGFKRGFSSVTRCLLFSIYNPELTCTTSEHQTAYGTAGIVVRALGRYFSRTKGAKLADRIAEVLLESIVEAGRIVDKEPDSYEIRAALTWEGSLSHNGLAGAGRDFFMQVHQLEHEPSGVYPFIVHGADPVVLWPSWARLAYPDDVSRSVRCAVRMWSIDMGSDYLMNTALAGIWATEDFYGSLGMSPSLKGPGVEEGRLEEVAGRCVNMGKCTLPGIRGLGREEVIEIYRVAVREQPGRQSNGHGSLACPVNKKEAENGRN